MALCVNARDCPVTRKRCGLTFGQTYIVARCRTATCSITGATGFCIQVLGNPGEHGDKQWFLHERFEKAPSHNIDAFDRETIELLNRKPVEA